MKLSELADYLEEVSKSMKRLEARIKHLEVMVDSSLDSDSENDEPIDLN